MGFLSCVNSNCESETYIEVLAATNLKAAVQNANMFNSINKTSIFCPVCGEQMIYKPYDRPKKMSSVRKITELIFLPRSLGML